MICRTIGRAASLACLSLLSTQAAQADLIADIPAGTGYAAWELCTRTQQSGDDYLRVRWSYTAPKVQPLPIVWTIKYTNGSKVDVSSFIPFITNKRTAIYRKGLGCTLVPPGANEASVRATEDNLLGLVQNVIAAHRNAASATFYSMQEVNVSDRQATATEIDGVRAGVDLSLIHI